MLCEYCNMNTATIILKQNIDGETKTIHICKDCAAGLGITFDEVDSASALSDDMDAFFASMFGKKDTDSQTMACKFCGMTLSELQKTGKAGCAHCYEVFSESMDKAIRHLHSAASHCGKVPQGVGGQMSVTRKIEELKLKLQVAVQNEEYEQAAKFRDEIKALAAKEA